MNRRPWERWRYTRPSDFGWAFAPIIGFVAIGASLGFRGDVIMTAIPFVAVPWVVYWGEVRWTERMRRRWDAANRT